MKKNNSWDRSGETYTDKEIKNDAKIYLRQIRMILDGKTDKIVNIFCDCDAKELIINTLKSL